MGINLQRSKCHTNDFGLCPIGNEKLLKGFHWRKSIIKCVLSKEHPANREEGGYR